MPKFLRRLSALFHSSRMQRKLGEEMAAHRDMMPADRRPYFGSTLRFQEEAGDQWGWTWLDHFRQDLLYGARSLRRSPGFALAAIAVLSLGIGANLAEFDLFNAFLHRLNVPDPDSLCQFFRISRQNPATGSFAIPETESYRRENTVLSAVISETDLRDACPAEDSVELRCVLVSGNFFGALRVPLWFGLVAPLMAQSIPQPAFDVASVKPSPASGPSNSNFPLGPGNAYTPNGGYFSATGFPLITYIAFAYKVMGEQSLEQLPGWARTDRFDIQARVQGNPTKDQMRLMMRSLLAERFKLAIHDDTRQVSVAALVLVKASKLGSQLRAHPADSPCPTDAPPAAVSSDPRYPLLCGGLLPMQPSAPGRIRLAGRNVTIDFIAKSLTPGVGQGRPLVDRTTLTGTFDFNIEWAPEIPGPVKPGAEEQPDRGPTFEEALREQLGFKLESQKGPIPVFVVDHLEHPSEN